MAVRGNLGRAVTRGHQACNAFDQRPRGRRGSHDARLRGSRFRHAAGQRVAHGLLDVARDGRTVLVAQSGGALRLRCGFYRAQPGFGQGRAWGTQES
jgi:hypothetical protein